MAARKKRKITKAHLRALQAGRKRYLKAQQSKNPKRKPKRTAKHKSKANPIRKHPKKAPKTRRGWWLFRSRNGDCRLGYGTHAAALKQGQRISDRTQQELDMSGPFASRQDASRLCA